MENTSASLKLEEQTRQAYRELVLAQNHSRANQKIMKCLPKHKVARYQKLISSNAMTLFNANATWDNIMDKLKPEQMDRLYKELVV